MTVILTMVYKDLGGPDALLAACLIAGLLQIAYGLLKVGRFISFVPYPVIVGFTNGIAVLIFTQQLPILAEAPLLAAITLAVIIAVPYVHRGIPRALVGLLAGTLVASFAFHHMGALRWAIDADTLSFVASDTLRTIGEIPRSFSFPGLPALEWSVWSRLIPAGLTISLLGTLETLLASVVADSMTGDRHNSERELIGQGIGQLCRRDCLAESRDRRDCANKCQHTCRRTTKLGRHDPCPGSGRHHDGAFSLGQRRPPRRARRRAHDDSGRHVRVGTAAPPSQVASARRPCPSPDHGYHHHRRPDHGRPGRLRARRLSLRLPHERAGRYEPADGKS